MPRKKEPKARFTAREKALLRAVEHAPSDKAKAALTSVIQSFSGGMSETVLPRVS